MDRKQVHCPGCDLRTLEIERLRELLKDVTLTAQVLYQNSLGCEVLHHEADFKRDGIPGWLADSSKAIEAARAELDMSPNCDSETQE